MDSLLPIMPIVFIGFSQLAFHIFLAVILVFPLSNRCPTRNPTKESPIEMNIE